jgi:PAS domain S-box-containing protein
VKESTQRKEKEEKERAIQKNKNKNEQAPKLRLVNSPQHTVVEKKQAMVEKIWEDLVQNYSFLDVSSDNAGADALQSSKKFNRDIYPGFASRLSSNIENNTVILENGMVGEYEQGNIFTEEHLKFTKAVQLSQSFVLIIDQSGLIEYANPHFQSISGYTQDELVGKEFGFLISDLASHEEYEQILQSLKTGVSWKGELVNTKKNGEWYIFTAKISPVNINSEDSIDFIVVGHDITSFRETEIKLEQAVEEKSILLSELHHRVKNNLAIISGIMQLQAFDENDNELKTKLFSSVGRVKTLASMHELLYESSSFTMLEFGKNINKIVDTVAEMFENEDAKVKVNYDLEPIILNINQAHPCALILNEVVTNSFKKAFKLTDEVPKLDIKLITYGKKVMIEVKDNIGSVPDGYTAAKQPLSLQLIKTLVLQLNGQFNYLTDDYGTIFSLVFEKEHKKGTGNARLS